MLVRSLPLLSGLTIRRCRELWCRSQTQPSVLLWLWHRLAATALIGPLAREPPYAVGAAQEIAKKKNGFCKVLGISITILLSFFLSFVFFVVVVAVVAAISRAAPAAYGDSQARGLIGAVAAGLCQSHSNVRSYPHLQPTLQLTAMPVL